MARRPRKRLVVAGQKDLPFELGGKFPQRPPVLAVQENRRRELVEDAASRLRRGRMGRAGQALPVNRAPVLAPQPHPGGRDHAVRRDDHRMLRPPPTSRLAKRRNLLDAAMSCHCNPKRQRGKCRPRSGLTVTVHRPLLICRRFRIESRLSLRESSYFRGAKGDDQGP